MRSIIIAISFSVAYGQAPAPAIDRVLDSVRELKEEVRELKLELAAHRLALHEQKLREIQSLLDAGAREQKQVEEQQAGSRMDLGEAERALAKEGLPQAEREALEAIRTSLAVERPGELNQASLLLRQREHSLLLEAEQEQAQIQLLRRKIQALAQGGRNAP